MDMQEIKEMILQKAKEGIVVYLAFDDELMGAPLDEFIQQPIDGILYDLNRDKATVLTFLDDRKWINDYAVALTIEKLKADNDALRKQIQIQIQGITELRNKLEAQEIRRSKP